MEIFWYFSAESELWNKTLNSRETVWQLLCLQTWRAWCCWGPVPRCSRRRSRCRGRCPCPAPGCRPPSWGSWRRGDSPRGRECWSGSPSTSPSPSPRYHNQHGDRIFSLYIIQWNNYLSQPQITKRKYWLKEANIYPNRPKWATK